MPDGQSGDSALFETNRTKLLNLYRSAKGKFRCNTKPYKSTRPLIFDVVGPFPAAAPTMAHAVAREGQLLRFFSYGVGNSISDGFGGTFEACDADTNQSDGTSTNGGADMVIEGISSSGRGVRIQWPEGTYTAVAGANPDADLTTAYEGAKVGATPCAVSIADPASLMSPPQLDSPFNLRRVLFDTAAPLLACSFQWDRQTTEKIGTLEEIPEGGGKSFLNANGDPRTDNRYRVPEGYLWRRKGESDSDFAVILELCCPIVVPISLVLLFGAVAPPFPVPLKLALDITIRVHGLQVQVPSQN